MNGIFAAGLILHKHLKQIDDSRAADRMEGALDQLEEALREIRCAAFVRRRRGNDS